jgi:putative transposase
MHTIRDEIDFAQHVGDVHINPVKHGLVDQVRDWAPFSFHRHVELGNYTADWAGDMSDDGRDYGER